MKKGTNKTAPAERNAVQVEMERLARAFLDFTDDDIPEFLTDAMIDAVDEAARCVGMRSPTYDDDHVDRRESIEILARLFSQTCMLSLRPSNASEELARHIAAVLTHPETPVRLYNAMVDELSSLDLPPRHGETPEHIALLLEQHAAQERRKATR